LFFSPFEYGENKGIMVFNQFTDDNKNYHRCPTKIIFVLDYNNLNVISIKVQNILQQLCKRSIHQI